jgi:DNA-binding transcriptional regulator YiaG
MKRSSNKRKKASRSRVLHLPDDLRAWRHARKLSQSQAALRLQISTRTLQEGEQGRAAPHGIAVMALRKLIAR